MNDYLLADDLSGALEAGEAFRARGRHVSLQLDEGAPVAPEAGTLMLFSTETRNAPAAVAATRVRQFLAGRKKAGGRLLFKKIDSTLRGPVGAEINAVMEELAPPLVVVCPASPAVGRTVRDGLLCVHGMPVADTEFRRDPGWPVTESNLASVLTESGIRGIVHLPLDRLRSAVSLDSASSRGLLMSDAETDHDLGHLVKLVRQREPRALFVGAGGLAHALAAGMPGRIEPGQTSRVAPKSVLFVSGSMSRKSRRQLELLRDQHTVPLHEIGLDPHEIHGVAAHVARSLTEGGFASLTMTKDLAKADPSGPVRQLSAVVASLASSGVLPEMLAATGGETAQALCSGLGIGRLDLIREVEPGVIITTVRGRESEKPRWMTIKPGGFGADEVWCNLIREL